MSRPGRLPDPSQWVRCVQRRRRRAFEPECVDYGLVRDERTTRRPTLRGQHGGHCGDRFAGGVRRPELQLDGVGAGKSERRRKDARGEDVTGLPIGDVVGGAVEGVVHGRGVDDAFGLCGGCGHQARRRCQGHDGYCGGESPGQWACGREAHPWSFSSCPVHHPAVRCVLVSPQDVGRKSRCVTARARSTFEVGSEEVEEQ